MNDVLRSGSGWLNGEENKASPIWSVEGYYLAQTISSGFQAAVPLETFWPEEVRAYRNHR
jgi:hypothetical protein